MAVGEWEPALGTHGRLDRGDGGAWVAGVGDNAAEHPRQALARRFGEERAARVEVDGRDRLVTAVLCQQDGDGGDCRRCGERSGEEDPGDPLPRAARAALLVAYVISNVALPVVWFPAMSVASQRNSVVFVTTND